MSDANSLASEVVIVESASASTDWRARLHLRAKSASLYRQLTAIISGSDGDGFTSRGLGEKKNHERSLDHAAEKKRKKTSRKTKILDLIGLQSCMLSKYTYHEKEKEAGLVQSFSTDALL